MYNNWQELINQNVFHCFGTSMYIELLSRNGDIDISVIICAYFT